MNELVSIITVYYNRENHILKSIESLINQTHQNIEIIIVDDGSTDNSDKFYKMLDDKRIRLISHENMGFTNSVKKAIELSNGEYIAIHGSGDISHERRIEKQLKVFREKKDIGIVSNYAYKTREDNSYSTVIEKDFDYNTSYVEQLLKESIIVHGSAMFRKEIYNRVGGYRNIFTYGQDRDLWLRMTLFTKPFIIPEFLYTMYVLPGSVSDDFEKRIVQLFLRSLSNQNIEIRKNTGCDCDLIDKYGFNSIFFRKRDKELSYKLLRVSITEITNKKYKNALRAIKLSFEEKKTLMNTFLYLLLKIFYNNKVVMGLFKSIFYKLKRRKI